MAQGGMLSPFLIYFLLFYAVNMWTESHISTPSLSCVTYLLPEYKDDPDFDIEEIKRKQDQEFDLGSMGRQDSKGTAQGKGKGKGGSKGKRKDKAEAPGGYYIRIRVGTILEFLPLILMEYCNSSNARMMLSSARRTFRQGCVLFSHRLV